MEASWHCESFEEEEGLGVRRPALGGIWGPQRAPRRPDLEQRPWEQKEGKGW